MNFSLRVLPYPVRFILPMKLQRHYQVEVPTASQAMVSDVLRRSRNQTSLTDMRKALEARPWI